MKSLVGSVALCLALLAGAVQAQDASGLWRTEPNDEGYLEVQIAPCGPALCGTILRARTLDGIEGPYPHLGRQMIWDMTPDGPGAWVDGQIWDPRNGRTYASRMTLSGDVLRVRGCVMGLCQGQDWRRVN